MNNDFSCRDGACVDVSVLCDFYADCSDGDDEDCGEVFLVYFICLR